MIDLNKIKLGVSPLTGEIYLYRHGKEPNVALDKRDAEKDVLTAIIRHMMHEAPKGSERRVGIGDYWFTIRVTPRDHQEPLPSGEGA